MNLVAITHTHTHTQHRHLHKYINKLKGTVVHLFNSAPYHEHVRGLEVYLHAFVASRRDGGEWAVSCPGQFKPGKEPLVLTEWETG
jgi:hypothetical protein